MCLFKQEIATRLTLFLYKAEEGPFIIGKFCDLGLQHLIGQIHLWNPAAGTFHPSSLLILCFADIIQTLLYVSANTRFLKHTLKDLTFSENSFYKLRNCQTLSVSCRLIKVATCIWPLENGTL